ncbi:MAG TPA: enoyl-CoA hydratase-related protein, partial [Gemmatimonadales bacterium]|nr:enoyl-CoA hydratase-related protein [Gemmatimonadales bacterium]
MPYSSLRFELHDGIALITVNRPDKLNALNHTVIHELGEAATRVAEDETIRAAILTGAGPKAFVAGADIGELSSCNAIEAQTLSQTGSGVFRRFERSQKPVLAAVNGFALGGGCELAMACHLRVASENAKFGQPEVKLGITPGYGGTVRLPRLVGRGRALELLLSGRMIDAQEALRVGLVNRVVATEQLLVESEKLLREILENGPLAVAGCLRM